MSESRDLPEHPKCGDLRLCDIVRLFLPFGFLGLIIFGIYQLISSADFSSDSPGRYQTFCVSSAPDNPKGCLCQDEFFQTRVSYSGKCILPLPFSCSQNGTCPNGLVCQGGFCGCRYKDLQEYSLVTGECYSKVGSPCGISTPCVANADCIIGDAFTSNLGYCHCNNGYTASLDGKCDLTFGQNCTYPSYFQRPPSCDSLAGLACVDGICACPGFSEFNSTARLCLGLVGSTCNISETEKPECTLHAQCSKTHPKIPSTCICMEGYTKTQSFKCSPKPLQ